jgi:transposase
MLLPPDLREWLPDDHLVWLVLQVVEELDLSQVEASYRRGGAGRQAYDPAMLTAVLIYAYCVGIRSSRAIERACVSDVALRVASAQQRPDHTTISRFRAANSTALAALFTQVLGICGRAGLGKVGIVAIDGTKIAANASRAATLGEDRLRALAEQVLVEAEQLDAAEDAAEARDGDGGLPPSLRPGPGRQARIRAALADLEAERARQAQPSIDTAQAAVDRAEATLSAVRAQVAERSAAWHARDKALRASTGHGAAGTRPVTDPDQHVHVRRAAHALSNARTRLEQAKAGQRVRSRTKAKPLRRNLTDPDSRVMPTRGQGFVQGYNAQLAVTDDHLIIATDVVQDTNDTGQFSSMADAAQHGAAALTRHSHDHADVDADHHSSEIGVLVADAGYYSNQALAAPGPDRLIAVGRDPATAAPPRHPPPELLERLQPDHPDRARYDRRKATVEPVIGQLKEILGLRRFSRRGLTAVREELALAALAFNLRRLHATA